MAVPSLDNEFMQYWGKLTVVEKESLLNIAKNYVHLKKNIQDKEDIRKKLIQEERAAYLKGAGKTYSWQDVKQMATNKDQRQDL